MVTFSCKSCNTQKNLTEFFAGKLIRCPNCGEVHQLQTTDRIYDVAGVPEMTAHAPVAPLPVADDADLQRPVSSRADHDQDAWWPSHHPHSVGPEPRLDHPQPMAWPSEPPLPQFDPVAGPTGYQQASAGQLPFDPVTKEPLAVLPVLAFATSLVYWVLPSRPAMFAFGIAGVLVLSIWMLVRARRGAPIAMLAFALVFTFLGLIKGVSSGVHHRLACSPRAAVAVPTRVESFRVHSSIVPSYSYGMEQQPTAIATPWRHSRVDLATQLIPAESPVETAEESIMRSLAGMVLGSGQQIGSKATLPVSHQDLVNRFGDSIPSALLQSHSGWTVVYSRSAGDERTFRLKLSKNNKTVGFADVFAGEAPGEFHWRWWSEPNGQQLLPDRLPAPPRKGDF